MEKGFLGYNASLMLDVVVCALVLVVPAIVYSVYLVKVRKRYRAHRNWQIGLGAVLLVTVGLFETDMRLRGGWENIIRGARPSITPEELASLTTMLYVHLVFAVSTVFLWPVTLWLAWRRFPNPPLPGAHSQLHKTLGWLSTVDIALTSITGLLFYYLAFVA
jgi:putative membrane protein